MKSNTKGKKHVQWSLDVIDMDDEDEDLREIKTKEHSAITLDNIELV